MKNLNLVGMISPAVMSDSYKAGHPFMYPEARRMTAYGTFRKPFPNANDDRIVLYGIRYIVENFLLRQWTREDVEIAEKFYSTHNAGGTPYPFPKDLFLRFIEENNGYFPITLEALPDGSVIGPQVPIYQIVAEGDYSRLVTWLEPIVTKAWYPSAVATLSRLCKQIIVESYEDSVDEEDWWTLAYRLHDFGYRGVSSEESAILGGVAHLLNFAGSDTMSACFYAQFHLNNGNPVAESIPASEHSVQMAHKNELEALLTMIENFGEGVFANVADTYDYDNHLDVIVQEAAQAKIEKGGLHVIRPDSGDFVEQVLKGLAAAEKAYGSVVNKKGYKVITGGAVIQGDGMGINDIRVLYPAVLEAGYAAQNVAVGMGGGLLQKVNRDTLSVATKLNYIKYLDGTERNVMKRPTTDNGKISLPGELAVRVENGYPCADPKAGPWGDRRLETNLLTVVYDNGPVEGLEVGGDGWETFDQVRERVEREWSNRPKEMDCLSTGMKGLIEEELKNIPVE
jgi:nicotinic acid phosphoribosyltransferase